VGLLAAVIEKIHPAYRPYDSARPGVGPAAHQRRRAFAGQLLGQFAAESGVFLIQMLAAEYREEGRQTQASSAQEN
jgi:hypothetical protein